MMHSKPAISENATTGLFILLLIFASGCIGTLTQIGAELSDSAPDNERNIYIKKNTSTELSLNIPENTTSLASFSFSLKAVDDIYNVSIVINTSERFEIISNKSYFLPVLENGSIISYDIETNVSNNNISGIAQAYVTWLQESKHNNPFVVCMQGEASYMSLSEAHENPYGIAPARPYGPRRYLFNSTCDCNNNQDCAYNEVCEAGFCEKLECPECHRYENHACVKNECCADEDCYGEHVKCIDNKCVGQYQLACDDDNKCTADSYNIIKDAHSYECVHEMISFCCGNEICEPTVSENYNSCSIDCPLNTNVPFETVTRDLGYVPYNTNRCCHDFFVITSQQELNDSNLSTFSTTPIDFEKEFLIAHYLYAGNYAIVEIKTVTQLNNTVYVDFFYFESAKEYTGGNNFHIIKIKKSDMKMLGKLEFVFIDQNGREFPRIEKIVYGSLSIAT